MNKARQIMNKAYSSGISLQADGKDIVFRYDKKHPITPDLKEDLRIHKAEILVELRNEEGRLGSWYTEGWILMFAYLFGEVIVIVKDFTVKLPERIHHFPRYELREIGRLVGSSDTTKCRTHLVKKAFSGTIIQ